MSTDSRIDQRIGRLTLVFLIAFGLLALTLVYWSVLRKNSLLERDDNPRHVANELRVERGTIYDVTNRVIAESVGEDVLTRQYASAVESVVGYYSLEYGTAGIEAGLDEWLAGKDETEWERVGREAINAPRTGGDVRLTIHHSWQRTIKDLLADQPDFVGAAFLLSISDSSIRSMVSYPSYNANRFDDQFEQLAKQPQSPLLNRATTAQYQPGTALLPFYVVSALDQSLLALSAGATNGDEPLVIEGQTLECINDAPINTWKDAIQNGCPRPIQAFAGQWSEETIPTIYENWAWTTDPTADVPIDTAEIQPINSLQNALVGQDNLLITPMQLAHSWIMLLNQGNNQPLQLIQAMREPDSNWVANLSENEEAKSPFTPSSTTQLLNSLTQTDGQIEYVGQAIAGPDGEKNLWYLGAIPRKNPQFAVVILSENGEIAQIQDLGREFLQIPYSIDE